ncbi:MAG TPA: hypothetical protein VFE53_12495 [Mucilaginibacter sp.]|jgi:hypothetical protein|nr:hypothetical protein [Mucilaginibacter sp.]
MKTLVKLIALLGMAPLFSCTKTIYTHQQAMSKYITKDDVVKNFGIPTERLKNDSTDQWLYRFEKNAQPAGQREQSKYTATINNRTADVQIFTFPKRFLLFSFDKEGKVIQWSGEGVDLGKKKFYAGRTIGLVAGIAAATAVTIFVTSWHGINFQGTLTGLNP